MAVDIYLKIEGDIGGESVDSVHKGEIDVLAWSWGVSNSGTFHMGGGGGAGRASFQDLSITKYIDKSTPALMLACSNGEHFSKATLVVRKAGKTPLEYLVIEMDKVMVTSISTGGSGGEDRLTENVSLNFGRYTVKYQPQKPDGTKDGGSMDIMWDIAANVAK